MLKSIQSIAVISIVALILSACNPTTEELVKQGDEYIKNRNYEDAIMCYQKAAERGSGDAQNKLAVAYYTDTIVSGDIDVAAKYAAKALENGDYPESMMILGWLYYEGQVVPQDYTKSAELFERLSPMDSKFKQLASYMLFKMYLNGLGVPQSDDKAVEYYCMYQDCERGRALFEIGLMHYYYYNSNMYSNIWMRGGEGPLDDKEDLSDEEVGIIMMKNNFIHQLNGVQMIREGADAGYQEAIKWYDSYVEAVYDH